jgi:hypothetical protein
MLKIVLQLGRIQYREQRPHREIRLPATEQFTPADRRELDTPSLRRRKLTHMPEGSSKSHDKDTLLLDMD